MWYAVSFTNSCTFHPRTPHNLQFFQNHSVLASFRVHASLSNQNNGAKVEYTPWLIVGLGNPGNEYNGTRHNVGFEMIDALCEAQGIVMNTIRSKVGPLAAHYQVPLHHILLVYDEMSLPDGVMRILPKGGHGHHNGVKCVMGHLDGCRDFPRLCIGVGNPPGNMDMRAYLLQKFGSVERHQIDKALKQGVEAVRTLVLLDLTTLSLDLIWGRNTSITK